MLDGLSLRWPWHPGTILFLLVLGLLYILALSRAHKHATQESPVKSYHVVAFFSALLIMALLLLTPIDTIGRTLLFSVHMAQLVILITLCSPLILFGSPSVLLRPLIELPVLRSVVRWLTRPLIASIIFNLTFLIWHAPRIYDIVIPSESLYHILVLSIFVSSLLNWWPLLGSLRDLRLMSYPMQMLYAFFDGQPVDIFAFILVFSGVPIYSHYAIPPRLELSPFADQAVAGALLLLPGLIDLVVMTPLFFRWLAQIEQRTRLADQKRLEEEAVGEEEEEWEEQEEESIHEEWREM